MEMGWPQKYNSLTILSDSLGCWMGRNKKPIESYTWECGTLLLLCFETNPLRLTSVGVIGLNGKKPIESNIPERMWNSSFAALWNKSSETDFCRIHWVEWEQTHRVLYLRECGTLLCVLKTICKSTQFCVLLWLKKYGFCPIAAEFCMPWKDHPSLCLTIHGFVCVCVCVCMIEGPEKQISQMSVKEVRSRWPSSTCREREKQEWELGNVVCSL